MPKTPQAATAAPDARPKGSQKAGSAPAAAPSGPLLLSPEEVRRIGETIGGHTHWQADLARTLGCSKSQITRWLNASRDTNTLLAADLEDLILKQIAELADLLSIEALPGAPRAKAVQAAVAKAIAS